MAYHVYETDTFSKIFLTMEKSEQEWVRKVRLQLAENPHTGKPLRYDWFREKKLGDKRLYYLIYTNISKVLVVSFGSKKDQQKIIDHILENRERYKTIIDSV